MRVYLRHVKYSTMVNRIDSLQNPKIAPPPWNIILPLFLRIFVWGIIFGIIFLLRAFFLLIFLTFVFAYIQANGVRRAERFIRNRPVRVVLVWLLLIGVLLSVARFLIPHVEEQAGGFVQRYPSYMRTADEELVELSVTYPVVENLIPDLATYKERRVANPQWRIEDSFTNHLIQQVTGIGSEANSVKAAQTIEGLQKLGANVLGAVSAFFLSLLFSFLIVLDLPKLSAGVRGLEKTRLGFVYRELAGGVKDFGLTVGRAFEAQTYIAILNTVLSAVGIFMLGLGDKVAFLALVVFLCSYIPVAGVFLSSVPICLLALQEAGFKLVLAAVLLITVIHMVEAYILNPKIYGHHLRINPVIVLMILTVGGKLFGVWGLILGVPVCSYIFGHAIRYKEKV